MLNCYDILFFTIIIYTLGVVGWKLITAKKEETHQRFELVKTNPRSSKWKAVRNGIVPASELRRDYINTHVVILQAIGISGKTLIEKFPSNWKVKMKSLKDIDWLKTNPIWQNRILLNGRVIKSTISITLASNVIKKAYDIKLTPEEQLLENNLKKGLKNVG